MKPLKNAVWVRRCRSFGSRDRRVGRRAFLAASLAGGLALVGWRGMRPWRPPDAAPGSPPGGAKETPDLAAAEPWPTLREVVIPADELSPSGDDLAG